MRRCVGRLLACIALTALVSACRLAPTLDVPAFAPTTNVVVGDTAAPTDAGTYPTATHTPLPQPSPTADLLTELRLNPMPPADAEALARSMLSDGIASSEETPAAPAQVGDKRAFWIADVDQTSYRSVTATLRVALDCVQMWVEDSAEVDQAALERSAATFCETIYPAVRASFGSEWSPGIDGDPRLVVLNGRLTGAAGYFASANELSRAANPYSNRAEMFVMNLNALDPGTDAYDSILAHELQHMIHWRQDSNEASWVNEGASQVAEVLAGYGAPSGHMAAYAADADVQLTTWSDDADVGAHYGASYLFVSYVRERLGQAVVRELVAEQQDGLDGLDVVLSSREMVSADELVGDWFVANALGGQVDEPRFAYSGTTAGVQPVDLVELGAITTTVSQYAADYYTVPVDAGAALTFDGNVSVPLVANEASGGRYQWWSNRGDSGHSSLQRKIDLTSVTSATLTYDVWHDIEPGWDYAHLRVSLDGGATWELLRAPGMSDYSPVGNALGWGYTGRSGSSPDSEHAEPIWVHEEVDLGAYVGQEIALSLDYITDDAVTYQGLCVDNWAIDAIGWRDDVETVDAGWESRGFVRIDNVLPQRFLVRYVEQFGGSVTVRDLVVGKDGRGVWRIEPTEGTERAILIVAGMTPATTMPAGYALTPEHLP